MNRLSNALPQRLNSAPRWIIAAAFFATTLSGACTVKNELPSQQVSGTVEGLGDRGELIIGLRDGGTLALNKDGAFEFSALFFEDNDFEVTVHSQPERAICQVAGSPGVVAALATDKLLITCIGTDASLLDLRVSTSANFTQPFAADITDYELEVSTAVQELRLTPVTSDADASVTIDSVDTDPGATSHALALALGSNAFRVIVTAPSGASETYFVTATRGGDALLHRAFGKASNSDIGDNFGEVIAISGDTMVVGAPREDSNATGVDGDQLDNSTNSTGAVYVFRRTDSAWQQEAYLKASLSQDQGFGSSVAIDGDTIAVGQLTNSSASRGVNGNEDDTSASNSGAVYVFRRTGTSWQQEAFVKASNAEAGDKFGIDVAVSGDTLAVGAFKESSGVPTIQADNSAEDSGAVYVFQRSGANWEQEAYLKASNLDAGDEFGGRVALLGDLLVAGAIREDSRSTGVNGSGSSNIGPDSGAVYVFRRGGSVWAEEAYVKASNSFEDDLFGSSLALGPNTLVVGAAGEDSNADGVGGNQNNNDAPLSGAVYVFRYTGSEWEQEAYLKASASSQMSLFGISLAVSGDMIAVGAYLEASASTGVDGMEANADAAGAGAVYLFRHTGTNWQQDNYIKASNTEGEDEFGIGVALSEDSLVVGAKKESSGARGLDGDESDNSASSSGAFYVLQ